MSNEVQPIKGYRKLNDNELALINEGKELAETVGEFIAKLEQVEGVDERCLALGKTNLQQGFMWQVRAIAQPTTF